MICSEAEFQRSNYYRIYVSLLLVSRGAYVGHIAGGAVGTLNPSGGGTTAGAIIGGIAGGGATAGFVSKWALSKFFESDSDQMFEIISSKFETMCVDYLISQEEADDLVDDLKDNLTGSTLKDMYQSENREKILQKI